MKPGRRAASVAVVIAALAASAAVAGAAIVQKGNLRVTVTGAISPRKLPRTGKAPIAVSVGGEISTTDSTEPPQLEGLTIDINRNGRLDSHGLPDCPYGDIQPASSRRALSACRSSLVGRGTFAANVVLSGQEPYPTSGKLLVFNGKRHGKSVLLGHIYAPHPFPNSFVIVFEMGRSRGAYGTELTARLPRALGSWGNLTALEMKLSRSYSYRGQRFNFVSAGCPAPQGVSTGIFPLVRTTFSFEGGRRLTSVLTRTCTVRR